MFRYGLLKNPNKMKTLKGDQHLNPWIASWQSFLCKYVKLFTWVKVFSNYSIGGTFEYRRWWKSALIQSRNIHYTDKKILSFNSVWRVTLTRKTGWHNICYPESPINTSICQRGILLYCNIRYFIYLCIIILKSTVLSGCSLICKIEL